MRPKTLITTIALGAIAIAGGVIGLSLASNSDDSPSTGVERTADVPTHTPASGGDNVQEPIPDTVIVPDPDFRAKLRREPVPKVV